MRFSNPLAREIAIVYAIAIGLVGILYQLRQVPFIADYLVLITAAILLYVPIIAYWRKHERFHFLDRSLAEVRRSLLTFLVFSAIIFPFAFLGNHFYQHWIVGRDFSGSPPISRVVSVFFTHLLFVALPEEFFYRGYLQERLSVFFSKTRRLLGTSVSLAWPVTAFIFAMSHSVITVRWWHIFIFFPGLAFGWLKERTGTILAPILFHAACNAFAYWVFRAYG